MQSDRIILRPLRPEDLDDFLAYRTDPDVCRYQDLTPFTRAEAVAFIAEQQHYELSKVRGWMQIGIEWRATGRLIGDCAVKFTSPHRQEVEIGYTLAPAYQGRGLATEAIQTLLRTLLGDHHVRKIIAVVDARNPPSFRLLERLGFVREAILSKNYFDAIDQAWFDEYRYALESDA